MLRVAVCLSCLTALVASGAEPLSPASAQADALEASGHFYSARRLLRREVTANSSLEALARRARLEDWYGSDSTNAYGALLKAQLDAHVPSEQVLATAHRGLEVALRAGRMDDARAFADQLAAFDDPSGHALVRARSEARSEVTPLLGGADALQFFVSGQAKARTDLFLIDYSRMLASEQKQSFRVLGPEIHEYFQQLAALSALGDRKSGRIDIVLSLSDKAGRRRTEQALKILGLRIARDKHELTLHSSEKKEQAKKQDIVAALAVDVPGIQDALGAGKSFTLEIPVDEVGIFPAESLWKNAFFEHQQYPGGMFEAFATDERVPRVYLALNSMDRAAAEVLCRSIPLRSLADFSAPLSMYAAALSIDGNSVDVPGGRGAQDVWRYLVGVNPSDSAQFLHALLTRDDGRLLAFLNALSQLDPAHQRFFTRSPDRAKRYYDYFRESADMKRGAERLLTSDVFLEFLREVPLNEDGSVDFPGAAEVWMVAKGQKNASADVAKLTQKMKRRAAPEDEDEILIRLARTGYKAESRERSELENFIAVCRLDSDRNQPMTAEAALLLAQNYSMYGSLYPYFAALGDLDANDYQGILDLAAKLSTLDPLTANVRLGQLHSFLALLSILKNAGATTDQQSLALLRKAVQRCSQASSASAWTAASLDFLDDLATLVPRGPSSRADAIRDLLLGPKRPELVVLSTGEVTLDSASRRRKSFDQVLQLQKSPPLDVLFAIRDAVAHPSVPRTDRIQAAVAQLAVMPVSKTWHLQGDERKRLEQFQTGALEASVRRLQELSRKRKHDERDVERVADQILADLEPWTQLAMTGLVYAWYLQPSDLVVSEDPMLLRKHEFLILGPAGAKRNYFPESAFLAQSQAEGSFFLGGLAHFSLASGEARATGNHLAGIGW